MASKIKFLTSATEPAGYPESSLVEVAFAGRSNAGKSSLLNALAGEKVAKVSSTPGKTALLNFFDVDGKFTIVDMPGYGFANRSKSEIKKWQTMIETYLNTRDVLKGLCLVMDIRRKWSPDEQMLVDFANDSNLGVIVVLTKSDKVKQGELVKATRAMKDLDGVVAVNVISSLKKKGLNDLNKTIFNHWVKDGGVS